MEEETTYLENRPPGLKCVPNVSGRFDKSGTQLLESPGEVTVVVKRVEN